MADWDGETRAGGDLLRASCSHRIDGGDRPRPGEEGDAWVSAGLPARGRTDGRRQGLLRCDLPPRAFTGSAGLPGGYRGGPAQIPGPRRRPGFPAEDRGPADLAI